METAGINPALGSTWFYLESAGESGFPRGTPSVFSVSAGDSKVARMETAGINPAVGSTWFYVEVAS
jgi:hypothetical protein